MNQSIASDKVDPGLIDQIGSGAVAIQASVAAGAGGVAVKGNVEGDIQVTNKKIEVNIDHGAVVNFYDAPPRVKQRDVIPQSTRPLRGFVNRVNELKRLDQIVAAGEAVVIRGMDGMGKSALLRQTANSQTARAMPGGVVFLEGIDEHGQAFGAEDVIQRLFDKLFESEPPLKVNFDIAQTYLSNTRPLVILNGLNLPAVSQSRMADLFPRGTVLIESNQLLESDTAEVIEVDPLPRAEAIELFVAKAGVVLDNASESILDAICALLADVPLAIVTAARAIRENKLTLERAYDILTSIKPLSEDALRGGIERAYALAHSTLTELERQFLAAAALAPGISVDPHWLHGILDDKTIEARTQDRLQAMGLLTANSPRLRVDPGLRDLARIGVDEVSIKQQLIDYLRVMLETHKLDWNYCADELGNILGMIDWAAKHQRGSDVISLGRAIDPYLALHGLWESWRMVIDKVLQSARELGDRASEAWALHQLGAHAIGVDQTGQAIDFLRQAFDLRLTLGDTIGSAYTQHNLDLLIPPASPGKDDGHEPPDKPNGQPSMSGRILKFLCKAVSIGTLIIAGGYVLIANAHNLPVIPETGGTRSVTNTPAPIKTLMATVTKTATPTNTPTDTPTLIPLIVTTPFLASSPTLTGLQNANCRLGPSTEYDPPYGTLLQGQTVDILGVNAEGTWFLVDHPQSFRYPCWVWNGYAVQVQGDLGSVQVVAVPPASIFQAAVAEEESAELTMYPVCFLYSTLPSCSGLHILTLNAPPPPPE
jgi:hypothetical protein